MSVFATSIAEEIISTIAGSGLLFVARRVGTIMFSFILSGVCSPPRLFGWTRICVGHGHYTELVLQVLHLLL